MGSAHPDRPDQSLLPESVHGRPPGGPYSRSPPPPVRPTTPVPPTNPQPQGHPPTAPHRFPSRSPRTHPARVHQQHPRPQIPRRRHHIRAPQAPHIRRMRQIRDRDRPLTRQPLRVPGGSSPSGTVTYPATVRCDSSTFTRPSRSCPRGSRRALHMEGGTGGHVEGGTGGGSGEPPPPIPPFLEYRAKPGHLAFLTSVVTRMSVLPWAALRTGKTNGKVREDFKR